ncbi:MAG: solute-binding protein [Myxococcales bacterium]|nr:solute-binding protein [Myxococcales bacterium]
MAALLAMVVSAACSRNDSSRAIEIATAASLGSLFEDLRPIFVRANPASEIHLDIGGSVMLTRKIEDLGVTPDLFASADWRLIQDHLVPKLADFNLRFAANELVLAFGPHSPGADRISDGNWIELVLADGVRLARVDSVTAPAGYQALHTLRLAERHYGTRAAELHQRFVERVPPERVTRDIEEAAGLIESRAADFALLFRSVAEEHRLRFLPLPPEINLGDVALTPRYAEVSEEIAPGQRVAGQPILYSLTIPRGAKNPDGAVAMIRLLLGPEGRRRLIQMGLKPLPAPDCPAPCRLPAALAGLVSPPGS